MKISAFAAAILKALEKLDPKWGAEFSQCLLEAAPTLNRIGSLGADRDYVEFVLASYRWRKFLPRGERRDRERRDTERLVREIERFASRHPSRRLVARLKEIQEELKRPVPHFVVSIAGTWFTGIDLRISRSRARSVEDCVATLDWHLRHVTGRRRTKLRDIGDVVHAFRLLESKTIEKWIEKRLQFRRSLKERNPVSKAELNRTLLTYEYHQFRRKRGFGCSKVCESIAWLLEEGQV